MASDQAHAQQQKQNEIMRHVLAESVVSQLIACGSEPNQLIDFAAEVIRSVTEHGFADSNSREDSTCFYNATTQNTVAVQIDHTSTNTVRLVGKRVTLQSVEPDDIDLLKTWQEDTDIQQTFSLKLLSDVVAYQHADGSDETRHDLIVLNETGQPVGLVSLYNFDMRVSQAESAKLLGEPSARGKGYASEAATMLLAYAFDILKLSRVYLRTEGLNLHNIKINERLGYRFEGILRQADRIGDNVINVVVMSMLAAEYHKLYTALHTNG